MVPKTPLWHIWLFGLSAVLALVVAIGSAMTHQRRHAIDEFVQAILCTALVVKSLQINELKAQRP